MLLPEVAPHGGVGVVREGIVRITHLVRTCRKEPLEVARFRELRDRVSALAAVHHRDRLAAERRNQTLEPVFVRRDRMRGNDGDESAPRFLNADVERVAEREVFGPQPDDPRAMRRRDVARAIDRARVDEQDLEIAVASDAPSASKTSGSHRSSLKARMTMLVSGEWTLVIGIVASSPWRTLRLVVS